VRGRVALAIAAVSVLTVAVTGCGLRPSLISSCQVKDDGSDVSLDVDQMANAATISAVAMRRQLPDHAVVVALATALQESKLHNLPDGDRDSIGLFQQRPSQGWGDPKQLGDPRYAAGAFYDHLVQVNGWQELRVTDAAQDVQRSAHPEEYQKWAAEAATLTAALVGQSGGALSCSLHDQPKKRGAQAQQALTSALKLDWGNQLQTEKSGSTTLRVPATDERAGWQYAHWMIAHAEDTGVERVRFGQRQWSADDGKWTTVKTEQVSTEAFSPVIAEVYAAKN
jgi:hypothetical protein